MTTIKNIFALACILSLFAVSCTDDPQVTPEPVLTGQDKNYAEYRINAEMLSSLSVYSIDQPNGNHDLSVVEGSGTGTSKTFGEFEFDTKCVLDRQARKWGGWFVLSMANTAEILELDLSQVNPDIKDTDQSICLTADSEQPFAGHDFAGTICIHGLKLEDEMSRVQSVTLILEGLLYQ